MLGHKVSNKFESPSPIFFPSYSNFSFLALQQFSLSLAFYFVLDMQIPKILRAASHAIYAHLFTFRLVRYSRMLYFAWHSYV